MKPPHVLLALACAADALAALPSPDGRHDPAWDAESERFRARRDATILGDGPLASCEAQAGALRALRHNKAARIEAMAAVAASYGASILPLAVHVWGPGWRGAGHVTLDVV